MGVQRIMAQCPKKNLVSAPLNFESAKVSDRPMLDLFFFEKTKPCYRVALNVTVNKVKKLIHTKTFFVPLSLFELVHLAMKNGEPEEKLVSKFFVEGEHTRMNYVIKLIF
jgi:hypothetical protein